MMYQNQNELCHPSINVGIYFSLTCWMTFRDKRRVDVKYSFVTLSSSPALRISLISVSRVLSFGLFSVFWARRSWGQMMTQVSLSILVSVSGLTAPTREITAALRVWPEPLSSLRLWGPGSASYFLECWKYCMEWSFFLIYLNEIVSWVFLIYAMWTMQ